MKEIGIVVTDKKGEIVVANEDAFRLLSLLPHDIAQLKDFLNHMPQDASTWTREEKTLRVARLSLGQDAGTIFVFFDTSYLEELRECLEEKNLFFAIINAVPEHIYVKDRNHRFVFVNEADARHHGFASPEEMLGKTDFDLHPEETARRFWEEEEELLQTGKPILNDEREVFDYSTGVQRKIWIATNKVPLRNEHGEIIGMVGINRDITLQKRTEEALRAAEREKTLILDALEDQVAYYEEGPRIVWVNKAALRNFGLPFEKVIGKHCFEIFEKRHAPCPGCATVRAFATGKPQEGEVTSRDGTIWHQRAYPILDEEGRVFRVVTVSSNVTAKKQAEDRILYLTFHDPLTGLYNRLFFEDTLKRLDVPRQLPLSIIMVDVNNLKLVNDALGHAKGDELLKQVAEILSRACRKEDIIARWGGDEFVILLPKTPATAARDVMERIRRACEEASKTREIPFPISLALGYATKEKENENVDVILSEAENHMYRDKLTEARSSRAAILVSLEQYLREIPGEMETHHKRMHALAEKMGEALGLSRTELENLHLLVRLHDIGKVVIPRSLLVKTGSLTEEEWAEIRKHPEIGYRIARIFPELLPVAESILAHHERFDGKGYPQGLKGKDIPLPARILALVDAFVAMTSDHPYRRALPCAQALEEIRKNAGKQFDPDLVEVFLKILEKHGEVPEHPDVPFEDPRE